MMQKINSKIAKSKEEYLKCLDIRKKVFIEEQKISENIEIDEYEDQAIYFLVYVIEPKNKYFYVPHIEFLEREIIPENGKVSYFKDWKLSIKEK